MKVVKTLANFFMLRYQRKLGFTLSVASLAFVYSQNLYAEETDNIENENWISPDLVEDIYEEFVDAEILEEQKAKISKRKEQQKNQNDTLEDKLEDTGNKVSGGSKEPDEERISPDRESTWKLDYDYRKTSLLEATFITGIPAASFSLAYIAFYADEHDLNGKDIRKNYIDGFKHPFNFDNNPWYVNYVGHTEFGAEAYLLARNRNYHPFVCVMYSAAASEVWESGIENAIGMPSIQDRIFTPIFGSIFGELRFQGKVALWKMGDRRNTFEDILMVLLDPIDAFYRLAE